MNPNHYLAVAIEYLLGHRDRLAGRLRGSARRWCRSSMIDRVVARPRPAAGRGAGRLQVVRRPACSTARSASAARSPPARRSCAATARCGPPTRTASCSRCSPRRSSPSPGARPSEHYADLTARFGDPGVRPDRRARRPRAEGGARQSCRPSRCTADRAGGRADHRHAHRGARQRRGDRRAQGDAPRTAWFAARPSGTEDVYKIYAESLPGPRAPGPGPGGGARRRRRRPRLTR